MMRWIEWLLGLEHIRLDQGPLIVDLSGAPSPWTMLVGAVLVIALIVLMYRYEGGSRNMRLALCGIRGCILFLILGIAGRPNLVLSRERIDPSVVAVMLDTSASMATDDAGDESAGVSRRTRLDAAVASLTDGARSVMGELTRRHRVALWSFSRRAERFHRDADAAAVRALAAMPPTGSASDPVTSVEDTLAQSSGARLAAIMLLSDGRSTRTPALERCLDEARRRHVPIHTIPFGSPFRPRDMAISTIESDEAVHVRDIVSVVAKVTATGYGQRAAATRPGASEQADVGDPLVELRDDNGALMGTEVAKLAPVNDNASGDTASAEVEFRFRAQKPGVLRLSVSTPTRGDERDTTNNISQVSVTVHDNKLRLLYVEGPPRFEYRFLNNTIRREPGIISACLLLDATDAFVQEGTEPVRAFPATAAELNKYDVVLLGDVNPTEDWLSAAQAALLIDFVGTRGGGIGFIAGERAMPRSLAGSMLEKLLPVRPAANQLANDSLMTEPFAFRLTPEGHRHPLLRLEVDGAANDATLAALPGWYWHAEIDGPKPGAIVLANARTGSDVNGPVPLLVAGRYGAGRTLFIGSDDVWRWRRGEGEGYYDTFWLNVVRVLAGRQRANQSAWRLASDRRSYDADQHVLLRLTSRDPANMPMADSIMARVDVVGVGPVAEVPLEPGDAGVFEGEFVAASVGRSLLAARDPSTQSTQYAATGPALGRVGAATRLIVTALPPGIAEGQRPNCEFTVRQSDPERERAEADLALLDALARGSGGQFVLPRDAVSLAASIPDRGARIADDLSEPLWDTRLVLILMVILLGSEWAARKLKGLA